MANPWDSDQIVQPSRGGGTFVPTGPADPKLPYEGPKAAADLTRTQQQINKDNATAPYDARKAAADALKAEADAKLAGITAAQGNTGKGVSPEVRAKALAQWAAASQLDATIADLETKFKAGPGGTHGLASAKDFFPSVENNRFDVAASGARGVVRNALGLTGGENNTAQEAKMNLGAYIPQSSDYDATILDSIERLKGLRDNARHQATSVLGGIPDANGQVTPVKRQEQAIPGVSLSGAGGNSGGPGTPTFDPSGGVSTPQDKQFSDMMNTAMRGGASFDVLNQMSVAAGRGPLSDEHRKFIDVRDRGAPVGNYTPPTSGKASVLATKAAASPLGSAAMNYLDYGGFGIPRALAGDAAFDAAAEANPLSSAVGQIGGALTGTSLVGKGATAGLGAIAPGIAPRLLSGGGKLGMFGRGVAKDAAFGAVYGGTTEGDPVSGAASAALGSVLGQGIGGGLGSVLKGGGAAAAQALRARGIPLTAGQLLGGIPKAIEDRLTSIPGVGDMVNARRLDGLKAFNKNAFGDIAGQQIDGLGSPGLERARPVVSGLYDRATQGVSVPITPQITADIAAARAAGSNLPPDLASRFDTAMTNRIDPVVTSGHMTGETYQQAERAMKGYRAETTKPGFEQDYRDALGGVSDVLRNAMETGGGRSVTEGLSEADQAYRRLKIVERAVGAARNGSRSGENEVFTPSQLNDAVAANANKYGGSGSTSRPFFDLGQQGQEVLPSRIPDSGTAGRLAALALPGAAGGATDYAGLTDDGAKTGLALGAILAAGGTKGGQKALTAVIADRPDILRKAGAQIGKRKGMFGSALAPLFIESLSQ